LGQTAAASFGSVCKCLRPFKEYHYRWHCPGLVGRPTQPISNVRLPGTGFTKFSDIEFRSNIRPKVWKSEKLVASFWPPNDWTPFLKERPAHQRLWEILGQAEKGPSGEKPSNQGELDHRCPEGGGI